MLLLISPETVLRAHVLRHRIVAVRRKTVAVVLGRLIPSNDRQAAAAPLPVSIEERGGGAVAVVVTTVTK